jgi:hypothetical protein
MFNYFFSHQKLHRRCCNQVKMNVIIGSSHSSGLGEIPLLRDNQTVEVWSRPGRKYEHMKELVDNHNIYNHGGPAIMNGETHFYIVAGLCNVTTKVTDRRNNYSEIIFSGHTSTVLENAKFQILNLQKYILDQSSTPIFSTIVPSHIETQNSKCFDKNKTRYLLHSHEYHQMQDNEMSVIKKLNQFILTLNKELGLTTPFLHRSVMHNSHQHQQYFQFRKLPDGCHASLKINNIWAKEITHAIALNRRQ